MSTKLFWTAVALLMLPSLVQAYLLMPFPGSQDLEVITIAYYLEHVIMPLRLVGALLLLPALWLIFTKGTRKAQWVVGVTLVVCAAMGYFSDVEYKAERMFEEPQHIRFESAQDNKVPDSLLVIGLVYDGNAKAYPINYLGYHHKVQDIVGTLPVLVTYCTMCRTGRVYSPLVNGRLQTFRLVGARHYNAVLEDAETKSWWYQATGESVVGTMKGKELAPIDAEQMTLGTWLKRYPSSLILQPDSTYLDEYAELKRYDRRQRKDEDSLTNPDKFWRKSWVVGITVKGQAKAYHWKKLQKIDLLNDTVASQPVLIGIESDGHSFHAFSRVVEGQTLDFVVDQSVGGFRDKASNSAWNWKGICTEGTLKGKKLTRIQAYQEYWLSWEHFHKPTLLWQ
ncbi:MAG: DUF3179 domain-containing (seleno)protein [Spirosomataceae bacterium]